MRLRVKHFSGRFYVIQRRLWCGIWWNVQHWLEHLDYWNPSLHDSHQKAVDEAWRIYRMGWDAYCQEQSKMASQADLVTYIPSRQS